MFHRLNIFASTKFLEYRVALEHPSQEPACVEARWYHLFLLYPVTSCGWPAFVNTILEKYRNSGGKSGYELTQGERNFIEKYISS